MSTTVKIILIILVISIGAYLVYYFTKTKPNTKPANQMPADATQAPNVLRDSATGKPVVQTLHNGLDPDLLAPGSTSPASITNAPSSPADTSSAKTVSTLHNGLEADVPMDQPAAISG